MASVSQSLSSVTPEDSISSLASVWEPSVAEPDRLWWAGENATHDLGGIGDAGMGLADWLDLQTSLYRDLDTDAADLVAETLSQLAADVRSIDARTVRDFIARRDLMTAWAAQGGAA